MNWVSRILGWGLSLSVMGSLSAEDPATTTGLLRALTGMDPESVSVPIRAFIIITVLSVVPSIILLTTCFPRILIVLSFLRRALGTPDLPSNQILAGLTLILTILIMLPVWKRVHSEAYLPFTRGELASPEAAVEKAALPIKQFMLTHTLKSDLRLFVELAASGEEANASRRSSRYAEEEGWNDAEEAADQETEPATVDDLGFLVVLPAFVLSELKLAFQMGFLLYLPFLIIDLTVSAVLISMGMFMLPPMMVSLPLKILVFVLVDGWNLIVGQLIQGIQLAA
jgi:flagellar biosynthetic protein FliP